MIKQGLIGTAVLIAVFSMACQKQDEILPGGPKISGTKMNKPIVVTTDGRDTENRDETDRLDSFLVRKDRIFYPIIKPEFDPGPWRGLNPDPEPEPWMGPVTKTDPEPDPWLGTNDKK